MATQGELGLLQLSDLNAITACAILSQCSLEQFVQLSPSERTHAFGPLCGVDRIVRPNSKRSRG